MSGASSRSRRRIARWARARESSIQPTSSLWSASGNVEVNARTFEFSFSWVCHRRATAMKGGAAYMMGTTARIRSARAFARFDRTPLSGRRRFRRACRCAMSSLRFLARSASQAANTSPPIAEPPMPTTKIRWASSSGTGAASPTFIPVDSCSGSEAMMSRIPPGSTAATVRASNILDAIHGDEIRTPFRQSSYQQNSSYNNLDIRPSGRRTVDLERALASLRRGEFVLVYDGDGREAETDLTIASELVTPAGIRTLRKEGGGLICMTVSGEVQARIGLPFMTDVLRRRGPASPVLEAVSAEDFKYDRHSAFSIAVNHRDTFTGGTDLDRAKTHARPAGLPKEARHRENGWAAHAFAEEFRSPGHVPLLNAAEPLFEERRGHTELTTALMIMAGLAPTATICEMMSDDGRALSKEDAKAYARERNLVFLEGQDIVRAWRLWCV